jgi:uncharacterized C2H2 Zn-finger protein
MVLPPAFLHVSTRTGAGLLRSTRCELLLAAGAIFSDFFSIELQFSFRRRLANRTHSLKRNRPGERDKTSRLRSADRLPV